MWKLINEEAGKTINLLDDELRCTRYALAKYYCDVIIALRENGISESESFILPLVERTYNQLLKTR